MSNLRAILPRRDLEGNLPDLSGLNGVLPSVMPAQAGIQWVGRLLDFRFSGNDKPAPGEYLCNV